MAKEETRIFGSRQVPQRGCELVVEKGKDFVKAEYEKSPTGRNEEIDENHECAMAGLPSKMSTPGARNTTAEAVYGDATQLTRIQITSVLTAAVYHQNTSICDSDQVCDQRSIPDANFRPVSVF
jgi:hypothetical protein